ncbi:hypothetical protein [Helicobacter bilis]|uniref:Uncharacterized protein n=1 Tax=Helicobacter bilis TaxID=37372 RepID=A0A099V7G5_9HELI|nr:hypothetical protein [Helicobacter bilis]TLE06885.1 hypothetical protein LS78_010910 [Helicobacter bilis]TLE07899.1 hypothetical protein LS79_010860 [Helicobacter bilis]
MHDEKIKREVEIFYKSNHTNAAETSRKFNLPYTTIKKWIEKEGWESGSAIKDIETTSKEVVTESFNLVTKTAQNRLKNEIIQNLGESAYNVDSVILNSLMNEASESLLIQAMSLNHINKSLALNASIAKNALMELSISDDGSMQSKMAIIACSEKVSKIFNELKTSLYGKEITITQNAKSDLTEMSDGELLELINKADLSE